VTDAHEGAGQRTALRLYVAGISARSTRAIQNVRRICDETEGCFDLAVIDIFQQPKLAELDEIVAVPTLVKKLPLPSRRLVGDLSGLDDIRAGLGLEPK
jgi:circadian clock protein KaiB